MVQHAIEINFSVTNITNSYLNQILSFYKVRLIPGKRASGCLAIHAACLNI